MFRLILGAENLFGGMNLVVVTVLYIRCCVHQLNGGLIALRDGDLVLDPDVAKGFDIKFWCSNPTEA